MRIRTRIKDAPSSEDGFTLLEIVIALVVFMIAVMGMVALQGASIHAATNSRRQTAAVNIARYVVTEFKNEFAGWDKLQVGTDFPSNGYPLLQSIFEGDTPVGPGVWVEFGAGIDGDEGFRLDEFLGHSKLEDENGAANTGASRFCVNYMVQPLETFEGAPEPSEYSVWQVRVRVSWTKEGAFLTGNISWTVCDPTNVTARIETEGSDNVVELTAMATRELAR